MTPSFLERLAFCAPPAQPVARASVFRYRTYIAGPMTGLPDMNFPAFDAAAHRLRDLGHLVISPAEITKDPAADWAACMRADIAELVRCDAVALLPGWEHSRGATLEHHIATQVGLDVRPLEAWLSDGGARC